LDNTSESFLSKITNETDSVIVSIDLLSKQRKIEIVFEVVRRAREENANENAEKVSEVVLVVKGSCMYKYVQAPHGVDESMYER
jgi:hypothetical protein